MFTISPYKRDRPEPRELGLVTAGGRVLLEGGDDVPVTEAMHRGAQLFAGYERIGELLAAGEGEALCWNGPIRWRPSQAGVKRGHSNDRNGWPVTVLRFDLGTDEDALAGLAGWRDWLVSYGARPLGSLGSTSFGLLKARLLEPLRCAGGDPPPIRLTVGGRQIMGRPPGTIEGELRHYDMRAAYAQTLGRLRYGGRWLEVDAGFPLQQFHRLGGLVFVNARVRIPELPCGPLPERPRAPQSTWSAILDPTPYPVARTMQGTWTLDELEAAERAGCTLERVLHRWIHSTPDEAQPFLPWLEAIEAGRRAGGLTGTLAKATGNALWGTFAISRGRRTVERWIERGGRLERVRQVLPARKGQPRAFDLAESVTGRVRAELYRFALAAGDRLVAAHTDGGWVDAAGWTYPGWRSTRAAERLDLVSPQVYRYWPPGELEPEHVFAGYPSALAAAAFEQVWQTEGYGTEAA